jgi:hypothetical protein
MAYIWRKIVNIQFKINKLITSHEASVMVSLAMKMIEPKSFKQYIER